MLAVTLSALAPCPSASAANAGIATTVTTPKLSRCGSAVQRCGATLCPDGRQSHDQPRRQQAGRAIAVERRDATLRVWLQVLDSLSVPIPLGYCCADNSSPWGVYWRNFTMTPADNRTLAERLRAYIITGHNPDGPPPIKFHPRICDEAVNAIDSQSALLASAREALEELSKGDWAYQIQPIAAAMIIVRRALATLKAAGVECALTDAPPQARVRVSEDDIFKIICEERETFHREGPSKTTHDLWQRKAARRIKVAIETDSSLLAPADREEGR